MRRWRRRRRRRGLRRGEGQQSKRRRRKIETKENEIKECKKKSANGELMRWQMAQQMKREIIRGKIGSMGVEIEQNEGKNNEEA